MRAKQALAGGSQPERLAAPVGGGGQLSGWAIAFKASRPEVRVIGVEPAAADDALRSFQTGTLQRLQSPPDTIADGVRTLSIGRRNFETLVQNRLMDDIVTVTEAEIEEALLTAWLRCKLALEPTGALSLAAFLGGKLPEAKRIGLLLSGGNADPSLVARLLQ